MKRLLFLFILCVLLVPLLLGAGPFVRTNGEPQVQGPMRVYGGVIENIQGVDRQSVSATTANLTLYVEESGEGGDDANDCLSASTPCETLSGALGKIPKNIQHTVVVDLGEGSFPAANVAGFRMNETGTFTIQGVLSQAAVTGKMTGTPDSNAQVGNHCEITDADAGWTPGELVGRIWNVSGNRMPIYENTGTVVYLPIGYCSGSSYIIEDQKTFITGVGALAYGGIEVTDTHGVTPGSLTIKNLKMTDAKVMGILFMSVTSGKIEFCSTANDWFGYFFMNALCCQVNHSFADGLLAAIYTLNSVCAKANDIPLIYRCATDGSGGSAIGFQSETSMVQVEDYMAYDHVTGIDIRSSQQIDLETFEVNACQNGMSIDQPKSDAKNANSSVWINSGVFEANTIDTIEAYSGSVLYAEGALTGTNASPYGVELFTGASFHRGSESVTVTGATGDFTLDGGTTTSTWAVDLAASGDYVVNLINGCRAQRSF